MATPRAALPVIYTNSALIGLINLNKLVPVNLERSLSMPRYYKAQAQRSRGGGGSKFSVPLNRWKCQVFTT